MKRYRIIITNDSAVSEAVGFILIFGIMLSGIGLITLYGYPMLLQEHQNTNTRNMERNMILLQSDVNSLVYKSVPYKESTMQVSGGVLSMESPDTASSSFYIRDSAGNSLIDTSLFPSGLFPMGELKYTSDSDNILIGLENGAVLKNQDSGSVMLSEPRWFIDSTAGYETLVITLIQVNPRSQMANSGISTVRMKINEKDIAIDTGSNPVNIIDTGPLPLNEDFTIIFKSNNYPIGWETYFINELGMTKIGLDTWIIEDIDRVIIKALEIEVISL